MCAVPLAGAASQSRAFNRGVVIVSMGLGFAITAGDPTIISSNLSKITKELHLTTTQASVVASLATLTLAASILAAGALGDRFGKKRLFVAGLIGTVLFGVVGAFAPNAAVLIGARAGIGIAYALLLGLSLAIVNSLFPERARAKAIGAYLSAAFLCAAPMPLIGATVAEAVTWRAALLTAPVFALVALVLVLRVPEVPKTTEKHIDVVGMSLAAVFLVGIVFGISQMQTSFIAGLAFIAVGILGGVVFVVVELRAAHPALNVRIFASATFNAAVAGGASFNFLTGGFTLLMSAFLIVVQGYSVVVLGVLMLIASSVQAIAALFTGRMVSSLGSRATILLGLASLVAGCLVFATIGSHSPLALPLCALLLITVGNAFVQTPQSAIMMAAARPEFGGSVSAVKSGVGQAFYSLGPTVFTLIVSSVLIAQSGPKLASAGITEAQARVAIQSAHGGGAGSISGGVQVLDPAQAKEVVRIATDAFVDGARLTSVLAALVPIIAMGLCLVFLPGRAKERTLAGSAHSPEGNSNGG